MDWYTLALFSLFFYGMQNFLFKVSAERKCNTAWTMIAFAGTNGVLGMVFFLFSAERVVNATFLFWIALIGTVVFLTSLIARTEALKHMSSSVGYPLTRLSTVLVVIFSVIYFRETFSAYQLGGISLAIAVLFLLTRHNHQQRVTHPNFRFGILLAIIALFFGAAASVVSKFVAISQESFFAFIGLSGILGVAFAFGLKNKLQTQKENNNHRNAVVIGTSAGLFNFVGYYIILKALAVGPLSIIAAVHSMNFVIAILLAVIIYKEELTKRRLLGIGLTIAAIILLRIS